MNTNFPSNVDPIAGRALLERMEEIEIYTQMGQFEASIAYARSLAPEDRKSVV